MDLELIIAVSALIISLGSAFVSFLSWRAQLSISKNTTFFTQKASAELFLSRNPKLLKLHNIKMKEIEEMLALPRGADLPDAVFQRC